MAESTLAVDYDELRERIGPVLGYGRSGWTSDEASEIDDCLRSGLRQFYAPPPLSGQEIAHQWSFLKPTVTFDTVVAYSTGTITVASGVVTLASGTFPAWAAQGDITFGSQTYTIASRDSDTQVTLDDTTGTASAGTTYELRRNAYDLPDDFGAIDGELYFSKDASRSWKVPITSIGRVLGYRSTNPAASTPMLAAIQPKKYPTASGSPATAGQRLELHLAPHADAVYRVFYRYFLQPDALNSNNVFAYGGALHSETILASCLAQAELNRDDVRGSYYEQFLERLAASIALDRRQNGGHLGYNGDPNSPLSPFDVDQLGRHSGLVSVTYRSTLY